MTAARPTCGADHARRIDWTDYGIWDDRDLPTNWVHVVSIDSSGGYDWTTLHAFWSPTSRRFFWASGSGCSCNSWGEDLRTEGDFENGDKLGLQRSIRQLAEEYPYSVSATDVLDAVGAVATFRTVPKELG